MCRPCHADTCLLSDGVVFWLLLFLSVLIPTFSLYTYNDAYVGPLISGTSEPTTHQRCRPHILARGRRREGEQSMHTHSTSTSVGRSSTEEMAKLNSLSLLSWSGKLYIQLYPSNPSTQTCQATMLLLWLDMTAGLTLAHAPAVPTTSSLSLSVF